MKSLLLAGALATLLVACEKKPTQPPAAGTNAATASGNPANAPAGYLNALVQGQQSAVKTIDTSSIDKAIQLFNVDQNRNPRDLKELVEKKYLPKIPEVPVGMKLVYDSAAGTVKVVKQ